MRLAHQMAVESDLISADMVESSEFPELAMRYGIMAVPKTVVNESSSLEGALPESRFVEGVMQAVRPAP